MAPVNKYAHDYSTYCTVWMCTRKRFKLEELACNIKCKLKEQFKMINTNLDKDTW